MANSYVPDDNTGYTAQKQFAGAVVPAAVFSGGNTGGGASSSFTEAVVVHDGTTTGGTRPTGYARVRWVSPPGTSYSRPTNMVLGDVWEHDA